MTTSSQGPAEFGVSSTHGFLPDQDPLRRLPSAFDAWEDLALHLPKALAGDRIRETIEGLPAFPVTELTDKRELRRAMVALSYLGHAYVWCGEQPSDRIPAILAVPWHAVATKLGRPPVLSYASYCLDNWYRLDPKRNIEAGNVVLIQNFLGGLDEEWFVLIHVDIEFQAAPAIVALPKIQVAVRESNAEAVNHGLRSVASALIGMNRSMIRMTERCDPYVYFHRVRPYIHGWRNHPRLPHGVIYDGVEAYCGVPQQFRGETGAQSAIVPALDALLEIGHKQDVLRDYLMEMRDYMPPNFRTFLVSLETGPSLRQFVINDSSLTDLYNQCVEGVETFRAKHLEYAATFIFKQAQTDPKNPHAVGTGGTPFMPYLKKHRDETGAHILGR